MQQTASRKNTAYGSGKSIDGITNPCGSMAATVGEILGSSHQWECNHPQNLQCALHPGSPRMHGGGALHRVLLGSL